VPGAIRIGACSWSERTLLDSGAFSAELIRGAEARFKSYAGRFDTVEVESSYYALPTRQMTQAWAARAPAGFLFHVRAYGALTGHGVDPSLLPPPLRELLPAADQAQASVQVSEPRPLQAMARALVAALEPLQAARKLGFVIFQFPPWFSHKKANRDYLLYCKELMAGLPIAVEFRHGSWLTRNHAVEVFAFLKEHKITYIACDEPRLGNLASVPFHPELITSVGYLRMHGRNAESWTQRADLGYQYLYRQQELEKIAQEALRLNARARTTFVMFNNCHGGHAVRNAQQLKGLLGMTP